MLTLCLLVLTALKISGTSIGVYHEYFYGHKDDSALIFGKPRAIRSDEWLVNSQSTISQSRVDYARINPNIGEGQDMSVVVSVPYRDWSIIFRPHNWGFFFMPLENAFALSWWIMGYLLILGCYFFGLRLLPRQRLICSLIALALFFSAFVQWWYAYGTLGSLYYSFFIAIVAMALIETKVPKVRIWLGLILAYLITSFALVLYPPFQIACAIVLSAFVFSYLAVRWNVVGARQSWSAFAVASASIVISAILVGLFISTRQDVVKTINSTAYPGYRSLAAGGLSPTHFFSSHLGSQFQFTSKAEQYLIDGEHPTNQSEASSFLLLIPFLILPALVIFLRRIPPGQPRDWPMLVMCVIFFILILELFVPAFTPISKGLFLHKVGPWRSLIGMGLLNIIMLILLIRAQITRGVTFSWKIALGYSIGVFLFIAFIALRVADYPGEFIDRNLAILLSVPIALVIYLLLVGNYRWSLIVFAAFSFYGGAAVNPLYKGLGVVLDTPLSNVISDTAKGSDQRWVAEGGYLINFIAINGGRTLSAVYSYPQFALWEGIEGADEYIYNRYAHASFQFDNDMDTPTEMRLLSADSFVVITNPCSSYLRQHNVGHIVTTQYLVSPCIKSREIISTPNKTIYVYRI